MILWRRRVGGRTFEVRGAGRTRRLLVDGVFHTQWNPSSPLTGAVWDPLALAGLLACGGRPRSALVLGLGGGAAVHLLRRHLAPARVTAVELDPTLVRLARRFFGVGGPGVEVVRADALSYVAGLPRRERFDIVVDDLFGEADGEPVRVAEGSRWWRSLAARTTRDGVLVVNFLGGRELRRSALLLDPRFRARFPSAVVLRTPGYANAIAALAGTANAAQVLPERLAELRSLPRRGRGRPRFTSRVLW
jgi:spermidine synthase